MMCLLPRLTCRSGLETPAAHLEAAVATTSPSFRVAEWQGLLHFDGIDSMGRPIIIVNARAAAASDIRLRPLAVKYMMQRLDPIVYAVCTTIVSPLSARHPLGRPAPLEVFSVLGNYICSAFAGMYIVSFTGRRNRVVDPAGTVRIGPRRYGRRRFWAGGRAAQPPAGDVVDKVLCQAHAAVQEECEFSGVARCYR